MPYWAACLRKPLCMDCMASHVNNDLDSHISHAPTERLQHWPYQHLQHYFRHASSCGQYKRFRVKSHGCNQLTSPLNVSDHFLQCLDDTINCCSQQYKYGPCFLDCCVSQLWCFNIYTVFYILQTSVVFQGVFFCSIVFWNVSGVFGDDAFL